MKLRQTEQIFAFSRAGRGLTPQQILQSQKEHQKKLQKWKVFEYVNL